MKRKPRIYAGCYRGTVVAVNDGEKRFRHQVRVDGVDWQQTAASSLRWAEMGAMFSAALAGDIPHFNVGDKVWIVFEHGDADYPVIMGAIPTLALGFSSVPTSQVSDYSTDRLRWLRIDRVANTVELSEIPEELWVRLKSGAAEIRVCQSDNSIRFWAKSGAVDTQASKHTSTANVAQHKAQQFFITSTAFNSLGGAAGLLRLLSNYNIDLHAGPGPNGRINIGGYVPTFAGVTNSAQPSMQPVQTAQVNLIGQAVNVGAADGDVQGTPSVQLQETEKVNIKAKAIVISAGPTSVDTYPSTPVSLTIDITSGTITIMSDTKVTVQAPEIDLNGTTKIVVTTPDLEVSAPTVNVNASGSVNVTSPSITMGS